jgi:hypothetical protein
LLFCRTKLLTAMKEEISTHIHDPEALEKLYRQDPSLFSRSFADIAGDFDSDLVTFWKIRLMNENEGARERGREGERDKNGIWRAVIISVIMAFLLRVPALLGNIPAEDIYLRNLFIIIFSGLSAWFLIKNQLTDYKKIGWFSIPIVALAVFLNLLPETHSDTANLAFIHAPVFMWFLFGMAFLGFRWKEHQKMSAFIRYNGELAIMTGLLLIAVFILSAMSISLFDIIGMKISRFYMENIAIICIAVSPVVAALLIDLYPEITSRIAPVIARIFAPLVLVSAVVYLISIAVSGISILKNREFLLIFNLLLLGVMAIIFFSVSEQEKSSDHTFHSIILFLLTIATLLIDLFALYAIITRLSDGITPNRAVVLISNVLILVNLILILPGLFRTGFRRESHDHVERIIYRYLPVYFLYSIIIIFFFPLIFGLKYL